MSTCLECGTPTVPGEPFCSNCGTQHPSVPLAAADSQAAAAASATDAIPDKSEADKEEFTQKTAYEVAEKSEERAKIADELSREFKHTHKGTTGGRQPTVKQLDPGSVLTSRYEIVRRIGGGGMGAVYLAKDRNLGDAPRAVQGIDEAHLDPGMHENAIGDFN